MAVPQLLYEHLSRVDYLVGTAWELGHLLPELHQEVTTDRLVAQLLLLGVGAVCIVEHFGCLLRSNELNIEIARLPTALQDTPGARDAFSAALTSRIVKTGGRLSEADLNWAVAAMAATPSFGRIPSSMPSADEISQILAVTPAFEKK
jgi:ribokinase